MAGAAALERSGSRPIAVDGRPDLPIAVLDASVLVPTWSRVALQQLAAFPLPRYRPVWSEWTIGETWRVLTQIHVERALRSRGALNWPRLHRQANAMMRYFLPVMMMVSISGHDNLPTPWPELADPDDGPVWATAHLAGAHFVVSHNTRDFPPLVNGMHIYQSIEYLTAVEFIESVLSVDLAIAYKGPLPSSSNIIRSQRQLPA